MDKGQYLDSSLENLPGAKPRSKQWRRFGLSATGLVVIGAVIAAVVLARRALRRANVSQQIKTTEQRRDKSLKDTYPASDPPASQYFDIPVNRQ